jgi:DegT/DnrJ/EryC1/StrS aminotransferase family
MTASSVKQAAERLAPLYGKQYGVMTASGMAAAELALELCGVGHGDEVIVPAETCFRVPAAILRRGARPVFAATVSHLLDPARLKAAISPSTRAVVAVHHFGLPCQLRALRQELPEKIALIEDAAQAFDLLSENAPVGTWSDYVISSFSQSKPVSLGGGGGVFSDAPDLTEALDGYGLSRRMSEAPPRSFPLHPAAVEGLEAAIRKATSRIERRRNLARSLRPLVEKARLQPWSGREGDAPCWHRLPLNPRDTAARRAALAAQAAELVLERPHETALPDLPMFASARRVLESAVPNGLFLRLDNEEAATRWARALSSSAADSMV